MSLSLPSLPSLTPSRPRTQSVPDVDPAAADSLLLRLAEKPMSGLAAVGNVLDLPGSMVRDVLVGQNPLDQLLSPMSFENRTTGRDLLRNYGMVGDEDNWGNFAGGMAAEILLDPTTYLTMGAGATTKAGNLLKSAGLMDDVAKIATKQAGKTVGRRAAQMTTTLGDVVQSLRTPLKTAAGEAAEFAPGSVSKLNALMTAAEAAGTPLTDDLMRQPLGRLFGLGAPFSRSPAFTFGSGPGSQAIARGMDAVGSFIKQSAPVRYGRALFDHSVGDALSASGQELGSEATKRYQDAVAKHIEPLAQDARLIEDLGLFDDARTMQTLGDAATPQDARALMNSTGNMMSDYLEHLNTPEALRGAIGRGQILEGAKDIPEVTAEWARRHAGDTIADTRGAGTQYHGSKSPVGDFHEGYYNDANIYGGADTFYTTDAMDVAAGYGRKSGRAKVYKVSEKSPVRFFNMEEPLPPSLLQAIFGTHDIAKDAIDALRMGDDGLPRNMNLREVMDEIRDLSQDYGLSRNDVQDVFDTAIYNLQQKGWGGMSHVGGLKTGVNPHTVKIYFNPKSQISLADTNWTPARRAAALTDESATKVLGELMQSHNGPLPESMAGLKTIDPTALLQNLSQRGLSGEQSQQVVNFLNRYRNAYGYMLQEAQANGRSIKEIQDAFAFYNSRLRNKLDDGVFTGGGGRSAIDPTTGNQIQREPFLSNWQGQTSFINRASVDPEISGLAASMKGTPGKDDITAAAEYLRANYTDDVMRSAAEATEEGLPKGMSGVIQEGGRVYLPDANDKSLRQLARWLLDLNPRHAAENIPAYHVNPVATMENYIKHNARANAATGMAYETLAANASKLDDLTGTQNPTLREALAGAKLTTDQAKSNLIEAIKRANPNLIDEGMDVLDELHVPQQIAKDIERYTQAFAAPESASKFLNVADKFLNTWKTGVTAMLPNFGFHMRNQVSGLFQNFIGGAYDRGMPLAGVWQMLNGKTWKGANKIPGFTHLTPEQATKKIGDLFYAHGIGGGHQSQFGETLSQSASRMSDAIPGVGPSGFRAPMGTTTLQSMNPLEILRGSNKFLPERAGRAIGQNVEDLSRLSGFVGFLKQGMSPDEAARAVKRLQVDYSALSRTEKSVMRRVMPFYSFSRGVLPPFIEELATRPGGRLGRTVMTTAKSRETDALTPEDIASSASIPIGELDDGTMRYLTGLGLMHEDPANLVGNALGNPAAFARSIAQRINPLLKAPLEYGTGYSFFQDRPLADMDPTYGRILGNLTGVDKNEQVDPVISDEVEMLLGNLPTSRLGTTARTLTDTRKGPLVKAINLLTGARISDVSPAKQDAILRDAVEELMREAGAGVFTRTSFRNDDLEQMTPDQQQNALALKSALDMLVQRAKSRREK